MYHNRQKGKVGKSSGDDQNYNLLLASDLFFLQHLTLLCKV